jgi:hypothetical protein
MVWPSIILAKTILLGINSARDPGERKKVKRPTNQLENQKNERLEVYETFCGYSQTLGFHGGKRSPSVPCHRMLEHEGGKQRVLHSNPD